MVACAPFTPHYRPMTADPQATSPYAQAYRADPAILTIADAIAHPVKAANFPQAVLRFRNDRHAATVGLETLDDKRWVHHFGRFNPMPGNLGEVLRSYDRVIVPEMNLGQLALLLRAKYLVDVRSHTAVRGLPFTTTELAEVVGAALEELS